jgi:hypothetical protein
VIARALTGCLCAFFAALGFSPIFSGTAYALFAAVTVAVTGGTCLALSYTKVSKTLRVAIASGVLVVYCLLAFAPGLAVHHGLRRLLTAALPLEPQGPELATVILLAGLATMATVEPLLRTRRPLLALLAPVLLAALACAIGAPAGPPPAWLAAAFSGCAAALLWLLNRRGRATTRSPLWLKVSGVVVTLAVFAGMAVAAASGSALLAGEDPAQARALVPEPVEPRLDTSPLALFPALRTGRRPVSLAVSARSEPSLLRFATLDTFDGTYWTTTARYRWAGRNLPAASGTVVEERVQVLRDDGLGWLVSSGRPVFVSVSGLGVDEVTGDIVVPSGQGAPKEFTIRSALPPPVPADLEPAPMVSTLDCAPDLSEWAALVTGSRRARRLPDPPAARDPLRHRRTVRQRFRGAGPLRRFRQPRGHGIQAAVRAGGRVHRQRRERPRVGGGPVQQRVVGALRPDTRPGRLRAGRNRAHSRPDTRPGRRSLPAAVRRPG